MIVRYILQGQCHISHSVFQFLLQSRQLPAPHFQQVDIAINFQRVDTAKLFKPVFVLQAVNAIYCDLEFFNITINDHLKGKDTHISASPCLKIFIAY